MIWNPQWSLFGRCIDEINNSDNRMKRRNTSPEPIKSFFTSFRTMRPNERTFTGHTIFVVERARHEKWPKWPGKRSLLAIHKIWIRLTFISSVWSLLKWAEGEIAAGRKNWTSILLCCWRYLNRLRENNHENNEICNGIECVYVCAWGHYFINYV